MPVHSAPRPDVTPLAVHRALAREGFQIVEEAPGRMRGTLSRRGWSMTVDVTYEKRIEIRYVDSQSLDLENRGGVRFIHRGYNVRVQRLADSIVRESRIILADVDPDAFLGPPVAAPPPAEPAH